MHLKSVFWIAVFYMGILVGCTPILTVPAPTSETNDSTPPLLRLGSAGLKTDILIDEQSTVSQQRRAKRSDEILFVATSKDGETGIKSVTLDFTIVITCGQIATNQTFSETQYASASTGTLPVELSKSFVFKAYQYRAGCREYPSSVSVTIKASAENGLGQNTFIQPAYISSYGPDTIRVATFNLYDPGNHADAVFERWGRELGSRADVLLLTEVRDLSRAQRLAYAAGMSNVIKMDGGDIAIASRNPLYNVQKQTIDPPGRLTSNDSHILSAFSDFEGIPLQFIGTHWGIRDANDVFFGAETSSPSRLLAAQAIVNLAQVPAKITFLGGDMNAYSGFGPQDHDGDISTPEFVGSTAEVDFLLTRFKDAFITLNPTNDQYCSNSRIDYVMVSGPYVPVKFQACFGNEASPSDHPFVLVTFVPGD